MSQPFFGTELPHNSSKIPTTLDGYKAAVLKYKSDNTDKFDTELTSKGYVQDSDANHLDLRRIVADKNDDYKISYNDKYYINFSEYALSKYNAENGEPKIIVNGQEANLGFTNGEIINTPPVLYYSKEFTNEEKEMAKKTRNAAAAAAVAAAEVDHKTNIISKNLSTWLYNIYDFGTKKVGGPGLLSSAAALFSKNTKEPARLAVAKLGVEAGEMGNKLYDMKYKDIAEQAKLLIADIKAPTKDKKGNPSKSIEEEYGKRYPDIFGDLKLREVLGYFETPTATAIGGYRKKQRKTRRSKKSRKATRSRKYRVNRI